MSSYTPGVPIATNKGLTSQPTLLENTNALDEVMDIDHYKFSDSSGNRGKHKAIHFVNQVDENPSTTDSEFALYAKEDPDDDVELFVRYPDNGDIVQITNDGNLNTGLVPVAAVNFDSTPTIQSQLNVASITNPASNRYKINFTTPISNNDYSWSISAMGSSGLVTGQPNPSGTYSSSVNTDFIIVQFSGAITRATVTIFEKTT
jgi:hypothetical protein